MREKEFNSTIPISDQKKIIEFYKTRNDNRISVISEKFGYSKGKIDALIDNYLKPVKKN